MRGVSAQSLSEVLQVTSRARSEVIDLESLARELFDVARAIDTSNPLVRTLSDSGRDGETKAAVVTTLFEGKVSQQALQIARTVVSSRWSEQNHILDALELAGISVLIEVAAQQGAADQVSEELFSSARLIESSSELSAAFDRTRDTEGERVALVDALLAPRVHRITTLIARQAANFMTDIKVPTRLDDFASFIASARERKSGVVVSAIALTEQQRERLERALATRYGQEISLNYEVDPSVVGGMQITLGDDLYDATVSGRIRAAQELLVA